jgi:hypothetical protein
MVNFFKEATDNIEAIEGTSVAENIIITQDQLIEIVHYLVKDEKNRFLDEYEKSNETYNNIFSDLLPQSSATYFDQIGEFFDTEIKIKTTPLIISPTAYFFYNFAYPTFCSNKVLILQ